MMHVREAAVGEAVDAQFPERARGLEGRDLVTDGIRRGALVDPLTQRFEDPEIAAELAMDPLEFLHEVFARGIGGLFGCRCGHVKSFAAGHCINALEYVCA
jgi:hypothetical protein